jgi:hypothetical protein
LVSNSATTPSISRKHLPVAVRISIGCSVAFRLALRTPRGDDVLKIHDPGGPDGGSGWPQDAGVQAAPRPSDIQSQHCSLNEAGIGEPPRAPPFVGAHQGGRQRLRVRSCLVGHRRHRLLLRCGLPHTPI